ncbi:hypothetical protein V8F20_004881 [Naviculisporaceae sp. PSN 640]
MLGKLVTWFLDSLGFTLSHCLLDVACSLAGAPPSYTSASAVCVGPLRPWGQNPFWSLYSLLLTFIRLVDQVSGGYSESRSFFFFTFVLLASSFGISAWVRRPALLVIFLSFCPAHLWKFGNDSVHERYRQRDCFLGGKSVYSAILVLFMYHSSLTLLLIHCDICCGVLMTLDIYISRVHMINKS